MLLNSCFLMLNMMKKNSNSKIIKFKCNTNAIQMHSLLSVFDDVRHGFIVIQ